MNAIKNKPILRKTVAMVLFVFGLASLVLPLLPGWVMIGAGLYLMSIDSPAIQGHVRRYRMKYPPLHHVLKHSYDRLHKEVVIPEEIKKLPDVAVHGSRPA